MYKLLALFGTASAAAAAAPAPSPLAIVIDPAMEVFAKGVDALTEVSGWVLAVPQSLADAAVWWIDLNLGMPALIRDVLTGDSATLDKLVDLSVNISGIVFVVYVALCAINLFLSTAESIRDYHKGFLTLPKADSVLGVKIPKEIADMLNAVRGPVQSMLLDPVKKYNNNMYKLLALFGTASAAAAAAPAPSPLAIVIDPAMEVFTKGVDALTEVSGWVLAVPQSLADAAVWWIDLNLGMPALIRDVLTGDSVRARATLDKLVDLSVNISGIVFVVYVALCAINLFLSTAESIRDYHKGFLTLPKADSVLGVKIPKEIADMLNAVRGPVQSMLLDPVKKWKHKTIVPLEGGDGSSLGGTIATRRGAAWTLGTALGLKYVAARA
ncbi:hypothetical protein JL720_14543 [Aureococcus anophagefferens]|nr:hypothetical protein JL720_14543 [Aureococcus anophagefferens]